jgi:hypothetical protein
MFIREFNNDLAIYELTLSFGNEILNDEKNTQIFMHVLIHYFTKCK